MIKVDIDVNNYLRNKARDVAPPPCDEPGCRLLAEALDYEDEPPHMPTPRCSEHRVNNTTGTEMTEAYR